MARQALAAASTDRPTAQVCDCPPRAAVGFIISMATLGVLLGVVLPSVGWAWTPVLVVAYAAALLCGLSKPL